MARGPPGKVGFQLSGKGCCGESLCLLAKLQLYTLWSELLLNRVWRPPESKLRRHSLESRRELPIVPLPRPQERKARRTIVFLNKRFNLWMTVAENLFHPSGVPRSHNSCWDFYFLNKKMREEVVEGKKGGKIGEAELWGKARDWGKLESPHWTPVTDSHLSAVYSRPTWDVWLNTATPAMSLELERRVERSSSLKTVLLSSKELSLPPPHICPKGYNVLFSFWSVRKEVAFVH